MILLTTIGRLRGLINPRKAEDKIDLSKVRCLVIDEADFFFSEERNFTEIKNFNDKVIRHLGEV